MECTICLASASLDSFSSLPVACRTCSLSMCSTCMLGKPLFCPTCSLSMCSTCILGKPLFCPNCRAPTHDESLDKTVEDFEALMVAPLTEDQFHLAVMEMIQDMDEEEYTACAAAYIGYGYQRY